MALTQLGNHPKEELALVEIATAILAEHKTVMPFSSLVQEIQDFLAVDAETFQSRLSQFYTDLNTDGSFISLGNNEWGLRAWYPVDAIDESIHEIDDDDETDIAVGDDESIDDNLTELAGTNDLDDLSDGDIEK